MDLRLLCPLVGRASPTEQPLSTRSRMNPDGSLRPSLLTAGVSWASPIPRPPSIENDLGASLLRSTRVLPLSAAPLPCITQDTRTERQICRSLTQRDAQGSTMTVHHVRDDASFQPLVNQSIVENKPLIIKFSGRFGCVCGGLAWDTPGYASSPPAPTTALAKPLTACPSLPAMAQRTGAARAAA